MTGAKWHWVSEHTITLPSGDRIQRSACHTAYSINDLTTNPLMVDCLLCERTHEFRPILAEARLAAARARLADARERRDKAIEAAARRVQRQAVADQLLAVIRDAVDGWVRTDPVQEAEANRLADALGLS